MTSNDPQPTADELAQRFIDGGDLTYAERAALVQDYRDALAREQQQ